MEELACRHARSGGLILSNRWTLCHGTDLWLVVDERMASRALRILSSVVLACGIAAVCTVGLALFWRLIGGGELSIHGWIAMALGILGSVVLSWVLMSLAFRSDREGWDDQVDNSLDPGRQSHDRKDDDLIY